MRSIVLSLFFYCNVVTAQKYATDGDSCLFYLPKVVTLNCCSFGCEWVRPVCSCELEAFEFTIINRWGEEIYRTEDPATKGWWPLVEDDEVFMWKVIATTQAGEKINASGHLTVLK